MTVAAPEVVVPGRTGQDGDDYWYDPNTPSPSRWAPPGTKGTLTTAVWKLTNRALAPGWIVRYELSGGPQAVFVPSGSTAVEVPTDAAGRASVEMCRKTVAGREPDSRTAFPSGRPMRPRFLVRDGCTAVSWTERPRRRQPGKAGASRPDYHDAAHRNPTAGDDPAAEARPAPPAISVLKVKVTQRTAAVVGSK